MRIATRAFTLLWIFAYSGVGHGVDLLEAYQQGLANDPKVLAAEANRNAMQKQRPISLAGLLPSLVLNVLPQGINANTGTSPYLGQSQTSVFYGQITTDLVLTQPLFKYSAWVTYWQSDFQLAQAQAQLEAAYQDLAVRVAKAYFEVLYQEDVMEFNTILLKSLELEEKQVSEKLEGGYSTIIDLDETRSRRGKTTADLMLTEQKLNDAREALREIIGQYETDLLRAPNAIPLGRPQPSEIERWSELAQMGNLQVLAASSSAEIAKQNIEIQFSGHLPTLDLNMHQYNTDNNRPTGAYQLNEQFVGLNLNVPIYLGGGVSAKVDQARDQYEQALHVLDQQRRTAQRQVKDAYHGVLSSMGRVSALQTALKSGHSALEGALMGFQYGNRTIVDILTQQSLYFQYWADYARARYDYLINGLALKQSAGTLQESDVFDVNNILLGRIPENARSKDAVPTLSLPKPNFEGLMSSVSKVTAGAALTPPVPKSQKP